MAFDLLHKDVDQIRFFKEELTSYYDEHAKSERLKNFLVVWRDLEQSNYSSLPHSSEFPSSVEYRCAAETHLFVRIESCIRRTRVRSVWRCYVLACTCFDVINRLSFFFSTNRS